MTMVRSGGRWKTSVRLAALWCIQTYSRFRQLLKPAGAGRVDGEHGQEVVHGRRVDVELVRLAYGEGEPLGYVLAVGEADVDADVDQPVGDVAEVVDRHPVDVADVGDVLVDDLDEDDMLVDDAIKVDVGSQCQRGGRGVGVREDGNTGHAGMWRSRMVWMKVGSGPSRSRSFSCSADAPRRQVVISVMTPAAMSRGSHPPLAILVRLAARNVISRATKRTT